MKRIILLILLLIAISAITACQGKKSDSQQSATRKPVVVTTLFPLYDFSRAICGNRAEVILLLPPGVEAHAFEPRPEDAAKTVRAALFIYTNRYMEPWAEKFISGLGKTGVTVVDASQGITLQPAISRHNHEKNHDSHGHQTKGHHHHHPPVDPHIWLDPSNAEKMVDNIVQALVARDPANAAFYSANAARLKQQLTLLDTDCRAALSHCARHTLLHGGHYAFGYLANRYGLQYEAAVSVNADAEPNPARMIELVKQVKSSGVKYVFSEEMVSPRLTEAIARESGASVLPLHNLHNVGKDDLQSGATYISLMRKNLENLKKGLECK